MTKNKREEDGNAIVRDNGGGASPMKKSKKQHSESNQNDKASSSKKRIQSAKADVPQDEKLLSTMLLYYAIERPTTFEQLSEDCEYDMKTEAWAATFKEAKDLGYIEANKEEGYLLTENGVIKANSFRKDPYRKPTTDEEHAQNIRNLLRRKKSAEIFDALLAEDAALSNKEIADKFGCREGNHQFFYGLKELKDLRIVGVHPDCGGRAKKFCLTGKAFLDGKQPYYDLKEGGPKRKATLKPKDVNKSQNKAAKKRKVSRDNNNEKEENEEQEEGEQMPKKKEARCEPTHETKSPDDDDDKIKSINAISIEKSTDVENNEHDEAAEDTHPGKEVLKEEHVFAQEAREEAEPEECRQSKEEKEQEELVGEDPVRDNMEGGEAEPKPMQTHNRLESINNKEEATEEANNDLNPTKSVPGTMNTMGPAHNATDTSLEETDADADAEGSKAVLEVEQQNEDKKENFLEVVEQSDSKDEDSEEPPKCKKALDEACVATPHHESNAGPADGQSRPKKGAANEDVSDSTSKNVTREGGDGEEEEEFKLYDEKKTASNGKKKVTFSALDSMEEKAKKPEEAATEQEDSAETGSRVGDIRPNKEKLELNAVPDKPEKEDKKVESNLVVDDLHREE